MVRNILIVLLILFFETPCLADKCIPQCGNVTKKIDNCNELKDESICFDCGGASAVNWTFDGGPVPPNMCASEGFLWATEQDTSASLNSGTYECWPNNSSESRTPIKTVKVKFTDTHPHWVLNNFTLTCPTQFCAKSFTWTFARSLTGPYLERLPPYVTRNGDNIIINNMTKAAVGFYNCSVTPKDDTLPVAGRIMRIQMQQPSQFTNCEPTVCATWSSTTQSYKCNVNLAVQSPPAQITLSCPSIGRLSTTLHVGREYYVSEGRLIIQYSSREDLSFTTTVSITNVKADTNKTECEVKVGRNWKFDVRKFTLCYTDPSILMEWIIFGSLAGAICLIAFVAFFAIQYFLYQLWFWCRRARRQLRKKKRTGSLLQPQVVLVYCEGREDIAKKTIKYLRKKLKNLYPHVGYHLVREGHAGRNPEDAIKDMVRDAHTVIVLLERASWDDDISKCALQLSFKEAKTRIYICQNNVFNVSHDLIDKNLIDEVKADITPACCKRGRRVSWKKMGFDEKELLLRLRIALPIDALNTTPQNYPSTPEDSSEQCQDIAEI